MARTPTPALRPEGPGQDRTGDYTDSILSTTQPSSHRPSPKRPTPPSDVQNPTSSGSGMINQVCQTLEEHAMVVDSQHSDHMRLLKQLQQSIQNIVQDHTQKQSISAHDLVRTREQLIQARSERDVAVRQRNQLERSLRSLQTRYELELTNVTALNAQLGEMDALQDRIALLEDQLVDLGHIPVGKG
ncbi:hypothetical protein TREMEDRAFT_66462 [Tremella mesenterica DSM 1558]|uniref:uncharacterized protein n=1 Tax=Tremella mesenterica (strain ATCC 24925 / CBS 8224 / DSM 1558 / NBRC 9311 / NRRL Y-6157 / RJB 2259-6 / UBC 559-6) TaxID=578456 RepID=UPI00032D0AF3|nr:uncharacterized protein TREMEDRAFT_66462 [Tremella mesenterica DSM 1558]EIW65549.1 hypothetical protein TREMEDRAFT_66462 [Tremella mesenterica DSM 1558]